MNEKSEIDFTQVHSIKDVGFDMAEYIDKRILEINQLEDRILYKEIVGDLLHKLYDYSKNSYETLEQNILNEYQSKQSNYTIYVTLIERKLYDPTDTFLYPMREEDLESTKAIYTDIKEQIKSQGKAKLYTIFLQTTYSTIDQLLKEKRYFKGIIQTEKQSYEGTFVLEKNQDYFHYIEDLYNVFAINYQSWLTVCTAYLSKLLDVSLCSKPNWEEEESIQEIRIDFEEYKSVIKYDCIPLWNLKQFREKTSTYPEASIDKIHYEHRIYANKLNADCEYLVRNTNVEISNIRRINGDFIITCPFRTPQQWEFYQVNRQKTKRSNQYPLLSNYYKESFSGSIMQMFQKSVKTKGEIARLIESFNYDSYLTFVDVQILTYLPEDYEAHTYHMDNFILDEIRVGKARQALMVQFIPKEDGYYLNEDCMSFLVTQVQKIFPEYLCIGEFCTDRKEESI